MAYLIHGLFFQDHQYFTLGMRPEIGTCVLVGRELGQFMYAGAIWLPEDLLPFADAGARWPDAGHIRRVSAHEYPHHRR